MEEKIELGRLGLCGQFDTGAGHDGPKPPQCRDLGLLSIPLPSPFPLNRRPKLVTMGAPRMTKGLDTL